MRKMLSFSSGEISILDGVPSDQACSSEPLFFNSWAPTFLREAIF